MVKDLQPDTTYAFTVDYYGVNGVHYSATSVPVFFPSPESAPLMSYNHGAAYNIPFVDSGDSAYHAGGSAGNTDSDDHRRSNVVVGLLSSSAFAAIKPHIRCIPATMLNYTRSITGGDLNELTKVDSLSVKIR